MQFIKDLEELAFGTRLKLFNERLTQEGSKVYQQLNIDFEPRWFTFFYLLYKKAPLSITEISAQLGITQPAVTQLADILIKKGLIETVKNNGDTRKRILTLSAQGKELIPVLQPVWDGFNDATKDLFNKAGFDLILVLDRLERALDEKDMTSRILDKVKEKQSEAVEIFNYEPEYKELFRDLNYEWLRKYFSIEDNDRKLLENPEEEIINKGGNIFFAKVDSEIVGTAALLKHPDNSYELAKMAVTEKAQGRQIGKRLALAAIDYAKNHNAKKIMLESSKELSKAFKLYRKLGFEQVPYMPDEIVKYKRKTIKMELDLKNIK
ncbi:MAG: GNAT family N-acetyltransferase [Ignavibacteriae bacterium]|nr:MAG: GNAT family N-acetyltransferase [Ignavibacteriota bacterium]